MLDFPTSRRALAIAAAFAFAGSIAPSTSFAVKSTGGEYNTLYAGLGAKGYDVVSYFTDHRGVQGSEKFTASYGGVTWQFTSAEHRDLFKADPARYAPQYGGFCSWGVSQGKLFDVDPVDGWTIADGRLYLNFNREINATFARDTAGFVRKADRNWPALNR